MKTRIRTTQHIETARSQAMRWHCEIFNSILIQNVALCELRTIELVS
jgi:hypothetical protein